LAPNFRRFSRAGLAEHLHDAREQSLGADAHVHRLD